MGSGQSAGCRPSPVSAADRHRCLDVQNLHCAGEHLAPPRCDIRQGHGRHGHWFAHRHGLGDRRGAQRCLPRLSQALYHHHRGDAAHRRRPSVCGVAWLRVWVGGSAGGIGLFFRTIRQYADGPAGRRRRSRRAFPFPGGDQATNFLSSHDPQRHAVDCGRPQTRHRRRVRRRLGRRVHFRQQGSRCDDGPLCGIAEHGVCVRHAAVDIRVRLFAVPHHGGDQLSADLLAQRKADAIAQPASGRSMGADR